MSIDTSAELAVEVPSEVVALAAEEGVEEYLPKVIEMTQRVFPSASRLDVLTDEDPEIPDDRHIVMSVVITATCGGSCCCPRTVVS